MANDHEKTVEEMAEDLIGSCSLACSRCAGGAEKPDAYTCLIDSISAKLRTAIATQKEKDARIADEGPLLGGSSKATREKIAATIRAGE